MRVDPAYIDLSPPGVNIPILQCLWSEVVALDTEEMDSRNFACTEKVLFELPLLIV